VRLKVQYFGLLTLFVFVFSVQSANATPISVIDLSFRSAANVLDHLMKHEPSAQSLILSAEVQYALVSSLDNFLWDLNLFEKELARANHTSAGYGPLWIGLGARPVEPLERDSGTVFVNLGKPYSRSGPEIRTVPEPSSLLLLGFGFLALALFRNEKLRKKLLRS